MSPLTPIGLCSSKAGGLSELEDEDEDEDDDDDECVDEAEEQAVELAKFLLTSLVMNSAAASISSFILSSTNVIFAGDSLATRDKDGGISACFDEIPVT